MAKTKSPYKRPFTNIPITWPILYPPSWNAEEGLSFGKVEERIDHKHNCRFYTLTYEHEGQLLRAEVMATQRLYESTYLNDKQWCDYMTDLLVKEMESQIGLADATRAYTEAVAEELKTNFKNAVRRVEFMSIGVAKELEMWWNE